MQLREQDFVVLCTHADAVLVGRADAFGVPTAQFSLNLPTGQSSPISPDCRVTDWSALESAWYYFLLLSCSIDSSHHIGELPCFNICI